MPSRRIRIFVWVAGIVAAATLIVVVSVAVTVFRSLVSTQADATSAAQAFEATRRLFPGREPLIVVADLRRGQVRINRVPNAPRKNVDTIYFMFWNAGDRKLVRGQAPAWVVHLRVSPLGIGNWKFSDLHVTLEDIERYAPGIIADFKTPDGEQVLVWAQ
jgi:hypothetical protein